MSGAARAEPAAAASGAVRQLRPRPGSACLSAPESAEPGFLAAPAIYVSQRPSAGILLCYFMARHPAAVSLNVLVERLLPGGVLRCTYLYVYHAVQPLSHPDPLPVPLTLIDLNARGPDAMLGLCGQAGHVAGDACSRPGRPDLATPRCLHLQQELFLLFARQAFNRS